MAVGSGFSADWAAETTKRLHLNLLIQGAAVRETCPVDLGNEFWRPTAEEKRLNDWIGVTLLLSQIESRSHLASGRTGGNGERFWKAVARRGHPFRHSTLLQRHGMQLFEETRTFANKQALWVRVVKKNAREHDRRVYEWMNKLRAVEASNRDLRARAAEHRIAHAWRIPLSQLSGQITPNGVSSSLLKRNPRLLGSPRECLNALCSVGWNRIDFSEPMTPRIEARAVVMPLLLHELAKGVAELSCAHGLAALDDRTYNRVMRATDKVSLERWGMQVGPELFARWESTLPTGIGPAAGLMYLSVAAPDIVEEVLLASIEDEFAAKQIMAHVCGVKTIELS